MSRPRADTMPVVTVPPRPNGLPTAITGWPAHLGGVSEGDVRQRLVALDLDQGEVGLLVAPHHLGRQLAAIRQGDGDRVGLAGDGEVGDDPAVGVDDEARADSLRLLARARLHLRLAGL